MYVENGWLSLDPIYLSLLHSHKFSDNFRTWMDFKMADTSERRMFWVTILLKYHGGGAVALPGRNQSHGSRLIIFTGFGSDSREKAGLEPKKKWIRNRQDIRSGLVLIKLQPLLFSINRWKIRLVDNNLFFKRSSLLRLYWTGAFWTSRARSISLIGIKIYRFPNIWIHHFLQDPDVAH